MKRVNYHLTAKQIEALKTESIETGLSVAELIRRAIDSRKGGGNYENKEKDKKQENWEEVDVCIKQF
ncbi:MAG: ribbon-helix-helix protein, CopG family [Methanobacteriota archaeon]